MTRHSKNATSSSFYSYHERKKIRELGVGVLKGLLDTGACRRFECCWLCLRAARKPLATPQGLLFCKECLFMNFEKQNKRMKKEQQDWAELQAKKQRETAAAAAAAANEAQRSFLAVADSLTLETAAMGKVSSAPRTAAEFRERLEYRPSLSHEEARAKNFWVPENTPQAPDEPVKPPQRHLCCPVTGEPLRLKQLVEIHPEVAAANDSETTRWLCALSRREICHQKAAVVKSSGQVILLEILEKLIFGKKGALSSGLIEKKDVVLLAPGGTGFSAHNGVEVVVERPNIQ